MTPIRWLLAVGLLAWPLRLVSAEPHSASPGDVGCVVPGELADPGASLPHVAKAVRKGEVRILVVGTASALGMGNSATEAAWPYRMAAALRSRIPGSDVRLQVHAKRGSMAQEQRTMLVAALREVRPDLVVWQAGTLETVRNTDPQEMVAALESGIAAAHAAGADVVLMDQQFSRFLRANAQVDAYRDAIRLVALGSGVPLLQRYELMRIWAENDRLDMEDVPNGKHHAMADRLHDCLGQALAQLTLKAAK